MHVESTKRAEEAMLPAATRKERPALLHPRGATARARSRAPISSGQLQRALDQRNALLGSALLGATVGSQLILTAILVAPPRRRPDVSLMTRLASGYFRPDWDIPIYLTGCALSVALTLGFCCFWRAIVDSTGPLQRLGYLLRAGRAQLWAAALAALSGYTAICVARSLPQGSLFKWVGVLILVCPSAVALIAALILLSRTEGIVGAFATPVRVRDTGIGLRGPNSLVAGIAAVALILGVLYVPDWRLMAGLSFVDESFRHWDFFAVGPTLGYLHGRALGTEVYSQYGVAWPLLFAWGRRIIGVDHASMMHFAVVYGCIYFIAYFFLLNRLLRSWSWAAAGTLLAIMICTQIGVRAGRPIWLWPSSTMLRSPMDLWFVAAILLHLQTGRTAWAFCAGMAVGLGLCFETDTGIYLIGTLGVYLLSRGVLSWRNQGTTWLKGPSTWPALSGFALAAFPILIIASRGTILRLAFWAGWTEPLRAYAAGMSALPIAELKSGELILFGLVAATYLAYAGRLVAAVAFGDADRATMASGTLAVYGLASLLLFVNRSHPYNLYHVVLPCCALATCAFARLSRRPAFGHVALAITLFALGLSPSWRSYPSLLKWIAHRPATERVRVSGADLEGAANIAAGREYSELTAALRSLRKDGFSVGILDGADATYFLGSGCEPCDRYIPILAGVVWKSQLDGVRDRFLGRRFDFIAMRSGDAAKGRFGDEDLAEIARWIEPDYELDSRVGSFGIWRRKDLVRSDPQARDMGCVICPPCRLAQIAGESGGQPQIPQPGFLRSSGHATSRAQGAALGNRTHRFSRYGLPGHFAHPGTSSGAAQCE
jgi:hypothetical protein